LKGERKELRVRVEGGFNYPWSARGVTRSQVAAVGRTTAELEVLGMKFKRQKTNRIDVEGLVCSGTHRQF
jgi:hypothetical protein